jgi:hypothetical protein
MPVYPSLQQFAERMALCRHQSPHQAIDVGLFGKSLDLIRQYFPMSEVNDFELRRCEWKKGMEFWKAFIVLCGRFNSHSNINAMKYN